MRAIGIAIALEAYVVDTPGRADSNRIRSNIDPSRPDLLFCSPRGFSVVRSVFTSARGSLSLSQVVSGAQDRGPPGRAQRPDRRRPDRADPPGCRAVPERHGERGLREVPPGLRGLLGYFRFRVVPGPDGRCALTGNGRNRRRGNMQWEDGSRPSANVYNNNARTKMYSVSENYTYEMLTYAYNL